ncbi:benzoylformate decarboxylase [Sphingobium sp. AP50]|uniref:thiamine pyrophosphate-binding protein n=1 Tax=Sphingobium sp. AP50 TaxID=1884369 RepID=UPI0008B3A1B9|nr:thiamine pyrophosphate-binding protein [Sphingobium sp. AP50]SEJ25013.1 benzoylformate decarboxylase [Sphingobium sp. AP50]
MAGDGGAGPPPEARVAFFRQLLADGITTIFGNPGSSEESLLDLLRDPAFADIRYYLAYQEGVAVGMADAYARAAPAVEREGDLHAWRRPALVQLHSYAGLANGLGMMQYARRGYVPMVVIAGEAGLRYDALDGQMSQDLTAIARPFVKSDVNGPCAWRVVDADSLLRLLRRAIKAAATPPMGPVFLALPMDILDRPCTEPVAASAPIFSMVAPDKRAIEKAADLLAAAERPLLLMGDGIAAAGAQDALTDVAELLGAPVWGGNVSEFNMDRDHDLFAGDLGHMFGEASRPILSAADAVLICGTTVLPEVFPLPTGVFAPDASLIHFDINGYEIGKNFPMTVGALGDPRLSLEALAAALRQRLDEGRIAASRQRVKQLGEAKREQRAKLVEAHLQQGDMMPLRAHRFMRELVAAIPDDALIFDEALTTSPELLCYLPVKSARYFQTRAGMLGTGLPGTLGLKVAHPDKLVIGLAGDGGGMMTIQALATAARHDIAAKFIICNNRSYRILKYNLQTYWRGRNEADTQDFPDSFDLRKPDLRFDLLAQAQGVQGERVETAEQIAPAIARMLAHDGPYLIDLIISGAL